VVSLFERPLDPAQRLGKLRARSEKGQSAVVAVNGSEWPQWVDCVEKLNDRRGRGGGTERLSG